MGEYWLVALAMHYSVDILLLMGANRLAGFPPSPMRAALAASISGLHGAACLIPGFSFLGNLLWRTVCLGVMGAIAYGQGGLGRTCLFILLRMALEGVAAGSADKGAIGLALGAAGIWLLCAAGFPEGAGRQRFVDVELPGEGGPVYVTALRDTGNTLTDPVTGRSVLVLGGKAACRLSGLTERELEKPVDTLVSHERSGMRLIPYRTVGRPTGLLLAKRVEGVKIGREQRGSTLVAFCPGELGGTYQALAGGGF